MRFRLRYQQHDFELLEGQFLIGRSATCQLSLDDPLVSRSHAMLTISDHGVSVEDLGSRNGVRVNGHKVDGKKSLSHGDRISIGSQEMLVLKKRDMPTDTQIQPPTQRGPAFGLLGGLADKAIALGHGDEAERILSLHMLQLLDEVRDGHEVDSDTVERAARYGV
jgi:predicted component of type VI protein secretion system